MIVLCECIGNFEPLCSRVLSLGTVQVEIVVELDAFQRSSVARCFLCGEIVKLNAEGRSVELGSLSSSRTSIVRCSKDEILRTR